MKRHLNSQEKKSLLEDFAKHLDEVTDGKVNFTKEIKPEKKLKILYTPDAFSKTVRLIMSHTGEIAWHCLVRKKGEDYEVYDVLTYPQTTGPAHVHVKMGRQRGDGNPKDPEKYYMDWYNEVVLSMPPEEEANLCGQCHSHVNMDTFASSVDMNQQKEELQLKGGKGFYLFQIWNKKLDVNTFLYDLDNGILYEKGDVEVTVEEDEFVQSSHKMLVEPDVPTAKEEEKGKKPKSWADSYYGTNYYDDWDDDYWQDRGKDLPSPRYYKFAIKVTSGKNCIELIVEAPSTFEAGELFSTWAHWNEETLLYLLYEDEGIVPENAGYEIGTPMLAEKTRALDISYEELLECETMYDHQEVEEVSNV